MKSKLSIASFILSLAVLILFLPLFPFSPIISLISFIMAVVSLHYIKKENLQGKGLAWASIVIFMLIAIFLFTLFLLSRYINFPFWSSGR